MPRVLIFAFMIFVLGHWTGAPLRAQFSDVGAGASLSETSSRTSKLGTESGQVMRPGFVPSFDWNPQFPMDDYEIGPGDIFNIHFWGGVDLSTQVYVSTDYEMFIPGIGAISVRGLCLKDLRVRVEKNLKRRLSNTFVSIALHRPREFRVRLTGAIKRQGEISANQMMRLSEVIELAGGLLETASLIDLQVANARLKKAQKVNFQRFVVEGDGDGNPFIFDGDSVFVPFKKHEVIIKGNINRPGRFQFEEESVSLSKVVEGPLGGFISPNHTQGQISITRLTDKGPKTHFVDQVDFFSRSTKEPFQEFMLRDGDQIYFPLPEINSPAQGDFVYLTGQIQVPGPQKFRPGTSLNTYISAGGGLTSRANYDGLLVYKASGTKVLAHENSSIDPGDTIYVPEVTFKFWQDHLMILTTFLAVVTTTIAISR